MPGEICNWETYLKWSNTTRTFGDLSDWRFSDFISSEIPDSCLAAGAYSKPSPMVVAVQVDSPYMSNSAILPSIAAIDVFTPTMLEEDLVTAASVSQVTPKSLIFSGKSKTIGFSGKTKTLSTSSTRTQVLVNSNNYKVEN